MNRTILSTILFCAVCIAFVGWRVHAMKNRQSPQFEIVEDFSLSHANGCNPLVDLAKRALTTTGVTRQSTLTVLALGDQTTANEPRLIARYPIPIDERVLETENDEAEKIRGILGDIRKRCEAYHRTMVSPIFLGVTEAVGDLRAHGCRANSHCKLFVDTDLDENVQSAIKNNLSYGPGKRRLPLPIDNKGIDIFFCGLATRGRFAGGSGRETRRKQTSYLNEHRMRSVWRALFTEPNAIKFEPYCPN